MQQSFVWDKHFITGLADVDKQHHQLVDMINDLGHLLSANELVFDDIEQLLARLLEYASHHFWEEELLMHSESIDSRHLELHKKQHKEFIKEIKRLHAKLSPDDKGAAQYLLDFLTHWLAYHILGADQNMARQLAAMKAGMDPQQAYEAEESQSDSATAPLLNALHSLFEQVSLRNQELIELNASLERKVAERTQALESANQDLEAIALTDVLTGLPNRRFAMKALEDLWQQAAEYQLPLSVMMIDADQFKRVNDSYGHDAGDTVLRQLADTMMRACEQGELICRLGGDEFLLICPSSDIERCYQLALRLKQQVNQLKVITGDGCWQGSVSIGIAEKKTTMHDCGDLIKSADLGVYAAKQSGKNCIKRASETGADDEQC